MNQPHEGYWESDEFEDLVARSLIGLYETKIKKEKREPKVVRFNEEKFARFRNMGCYFTPNDRIISAKMDDDGKLLFNQQIDMLNDGVPDRAVLTCTPTNGESCYLCSFYLERIPFLPNPYKSEIKGKYYRIMQIVFENTFVWGNGQLIVIDKEGNLQSCYLQDHSIDPITNRPIQHKIRPMIVNDTGNQEDYYTAWANTTIQFYQDRRYLWNVKAQDGIAKATFGVYPEQIKSLFYSRDLPMTESGRKRPILHWVQAHKRRIKNGDDVDVEKYLRGNHEFVMNGTKYKITNPIKEIKK